MKNYIFYYFMNGDIQSIKQAAPNHSKYWSELKIQGGPFADFSGGFICFPAENYENAISLINKDPFIIEKVLKQQWLKEWLKK